MQNNDEKYIPDGEWKGFYSYSGEGTKHTMSCFFTFKNGVINGQGSDDVGNYKWSGTYTEDLVISMKKIYAEHSVTYKGNADENGMWGTWVVHWTNGGFHLWPIKLDSDVLESENNNVVQEVIEFSL